MNGERSFSPGQPEIKAAEHNSALIYRDQINHFEEMKRMIIDEFHTSGHESLLTWIEEQINEYQSRLKELERQDEE